MAERTLRLYNTLTRETESVEPIEEGHLRFYSCGPTVYNYAHIGNFRSFLTADLILRTARAIGWDTTYVSNITDVGHLTQDDLVDPSGEDRMAEALEREGERFANIYDLARYYSDALLRDWHALNLRDPNVRPRATEHVTDQLEAVICLVESGHAYATDKGVYFSVESAPDYGKLSGNREAEQLQATEREVVEDEGKRDPRDFALWKLDDDHLMKWHSPWGWGYPGWHIECSVMGMRYLGDRFDLHAGGEDLIFPHHECEVAQNEALAGHEVIPYWVHTRFLQVEGEKMSKSKGNFYTVRDLIAPDPNDEHVPEAIRQQGGVDPLALRYALLSGQYRKPFNFTLKTLRDSSRAVKRYQDIQERVEEALAAEPDGTGESDLTSKLRESYEATLDAMCDDLNTPGALAAALQGVKALEQVDTFTATDARAARAWLSDINDLLGIVQPEHEASERTDGKDEDDEFAERVEALIEERADARADGNYDRADAIRDELDAMGVDVKDSADGTTWERKGL
ncbi:cysteine--tRNA ligase [Longibacter salinarum]|uniref:Cysteine--tRNA ligase n=1 Tax=Longibacter salinarum TaxID=1850348 RepID=A0A2A8CZC8_9BACT|nr:cysteine--tRNA ligase [Longibacter salinarum]PEN14079.1 cysteine--tRNA ligase [Longibacter salinarum]